jgi:hypothetical protein
VVKHLTCSVCLIPPSFADLQDEEKGEVMQQLKQDLQHLREIVVEKKAGEEAKQST